MKENIKELIYSIASGDAVRGEDLFNEIMASKAAAAVDDMQIAVAQSMFNEPMDEDAYADFIAKGGKVKEGKPKGKAKFGAMNKDVAKRMGAKLEDVEVPETK